ncbi:hypothetical protein K443DRAFT_13265 [Laccaria amethystina LaAM-08-1]|uniref:Uncharacterized protein n=1 Tax=Laccaria amethystina LaAM-08-1 TaxID=1095629 RepID=A0A0C9X956_9AGAR|nr:hypothetical protein K443DRAFT_13265 [Laccaria amethystina LaAM-08-1]
MPPRLFNNLKEHIIQYLQLVYNVIHNYRDFGQPFTSRAGQPPAPTNEDLNPLQQGGHWTHLH